MTRTLIGTASLGHRGQPLQKMIMPIVNLNGNSKKDLVGEAMKVAIALDEAMTVMARAAAELGHGRNFQTSGPGEGMEARQRLYERVELLRALQGEFSAMAQAIHDQT